MATKRTVSPEADALLEVVHDFGSAGTGTDTAASDLSAGPPWFGLRRAAEELEAAGLLTVDRQMTSSPPDPGSDHRAEVYFLAVTDEGRAHLQRRRR
jgi:hypothetical protein